MMTEKRMDGRRSDTFIFVMPIKFVPIIIISIEPVTVIAAVMLCLWHSDVKASP